MPYNLKFQPSKNSIYKGSENQGMWRSTLNRYVTRYPSTASCSAIRYYAKKVKRIPKLRPVPFVIPNYVSVSKLANLLNCRMDNLIRDLTKLGFANISQGYILSKEYVELILQEYNYQLPEKSNEITPDNVYEELKSPVNPKSLQKRAPVVTIMGHVDHGKTTIIDYLRKSSVVAQEHGGITQHIGSFQVITPVSKRKITFLDTPGHPVFLKMRERGANITDIIVLVVSIEDSIMPQTIEAIKHAKNSGNELIVAITKIDRISQAKERERAMEKVTNDLITQDIAVEKIGGDVQVIPISAKTGENMDLLEESIVILSDVMDIKAENSPKTVAEGWILESQVKKTVGNVATVLVKKGTVQKGKILVCGNTYCKVRSIHNEGGQQVPKALPSDAVEVLGWKELPSAGDQVIEAKNEATAKKFISKRLALQEVEKEGLTVEKLNEQRALEAAKKEKEAEEDEVDEEDNAVPVGPKKVNFIIKADVSGSAEAINESIADLGNDEVTCNIISSSVGIPNENDLKIAQITNGIILCFNLGSLPNDVINNKLGVEVKQYNVVYKLIEDVTEILTDNLTPIFEIKQIATVDIREIFEFQLKKKIIKIAGCRVVNGQINRNSMVQIQRGPSKEIIYDGKLATLKQGKEDATEVTKGNECGVTFDKNFENYQAGDKIIVYENVKVPRFL
ncbi:translation initiation factor 2 TDEL_0D02350 [Torulaspora delbrueckii]|uniref:Translation initiation factor IF-2, mitochondrial n=1 Tax=Torulaspora delbrueckii TaxID=4950 RepID=G8ZT75_TORDE|nr:hypothetical protein TDEL_0D02350 [Torulaspora delbrueckii]CCE91819.1 hypothetical protein TDEL_0D02350 [Torulaspora delbrueckii]